MSRPTVAAVQEAVAAHYELPLDLLLGKEDPKRLSPQRSLGMWLAYHLTARSSPVIAREFRRADHATVLVALQRVERWLDTDAQFRADALAILDRIRAAQPTGEGSHVARVSRVLSDKPPVPDGRAGVGGQRGAVRPVRPARSDQVARTAPRPDSAPRVPLRTGAPDVTAPHLAIAGTLVRDHEGRRLKVYDDASGQPIAKGCAVKGHPTIGVGRNLAGKGLSEAEVDYLLANDLADAEREAISFLGADAWAGLDAPRRAALIDMALNMGLAKLTEFKRFRAALLAGDWASAANEMLNSRWADQTGRRASKLSEIILTGQVPS